MPPPSTRAPLASPTLSQLNVQTCKQGPYRKRKRTVHNDEAVESVLVHAAAASHKPDSATFSSVTTIQRARLPLSWLSPINAAHQPPAGYTFKSNNECLSALEASTFIARLQPNGCLYAIEAVADGTYTAWPLSNHVSETMCRDATTGTPTQLQTASLVTAPRSHSRSESLNSDSTCTLPTAKSPRRSKHHRGAVARMSILTPDSSSNTTASHSVVEGSPNAVDSSNNSAMVVQTHTAELTGLNLSSLQTPNDEDAAGDQLSASYPTESPTEFVNPDSASRAERAEGLNPELLLQQYLESLYLSRTSLAFYSKGPLSRARALARDPQSAFDFDALREAYIGMILQAKKLDIKYKESIFSHLTSLHSQTGIQASEIKAKRRAPKKKMIGKDGLYSDEGDLIPRWWNLRDVRTTRVTSSTEIGAEMHKAIAELRNRETSMQLLLILEVLYLDRLISKNAQISLKATEPEVKVESIDGDTEPKQKKLQRKRDLAGELDSIAEKLSIWHTVAIEDSLLSPEKTRETSAEPNTRSKDKLRDFCRDVIIPFYGAKLPEQTKSICRKLGGPGLTPQRTRSKALEVKFNKEPNTITQAKPRQPTKRTLERVLSEDRSLRQASPPVLSRSATAPLVSKLKRASSEIDVRPASRSGMEKSVSFSNREIDLIADAKSHEVKRRKLEKLSSQKKELEEAINALKKPNRSHAAKAFMDDIDRRKTVPQSVSKSDRLGSITATPQRVESRQSRFRNAEISALPQDSPMADTEPAPFVPASSVKAHFAPVASIPQTTKKRADSNAIHHTPSRGSSKHVDNLTFAGVAATPAANRTLSATNVLQALDTPLPARLLANSSIKRQALFTPVKRRDISTDDMIKFRDVLEIPERAGKAMDRVMGSTRRGMEMFDEFETTADSVRSPQQDWEGPSSVCGNGSSSANLISEVSLEGSQSKVQQSIYEQLGWNDYDDT